MWRWHIQINGVWCVVRYVLLCGGTYCTVLYCTVYCTVLVLYCTVLYCTVLYCTVLYERMTAHSIIAKSNATHYS